MKVYISKFNGGYGGGLILVAANNEQEALMTASKQSKHDYLFSEWDCDLGETVVRVNDRLTPFEEVDGLTYNYESPCVICEDIYME